jgi:hypothetical protein
LSLPWRLSGLNNNTTLEIVAKKGKKIGKATIGFQLHDGTRFKEVISLDTTLWHALKLLEHNHTAEKVNATQVVTKSSRHYCIPVVTVMNTAYNTLEQLGKTTLAHLGLSDGGNALLKISFVETDQSFEQVVPTLVELNKSVQIPQQQQQQQIRQQQQQEETSSSSTQQQNLINTSDVDSIATPVVTPTDPMEEDEEPATSNEPKVIATLANTVATDIKLYYTPQNTKVFHVDDETDSDFELSATELKQILNEQQQKKESEVLKTRKMRALEEEKKKRVYDKTLIRIRFPTMDGLIIQGSFKPSHTLRDVKTFVVQVLEDSETPFYMQISPPVKKFGEADMNTTLHDLKLGGAAIINIFVDKNNPNSTPHSELNIKPDFLQYLQQIQSEKTPDNLNRQVEQQPILTAKPTAKATPKWFKPK